MESETSEACLSLSLPPGKREPPFKATYECQAGARTAWPGQCEAWGVGTWILARRLVTITRGAAHRPATCVSGGRHRPHTSQLETRLGLLRPIETYETSGLVSDIGNP